MAKGDPASPVPPRLLPPLVSGGGGSPKTHGGSASLRGGRWRTPPAACDPTTEPKELDPGPSSATASEESSPPKSTRASLRVAPEGIAGGISEGEESETSRSGQPSPAFLTKLLEPEVALGCQGCGDFSCQDCHARRLRHTQIKKMRQRRCADAKKGEQTPRSKDYLAIAMDHIERHPFERPFGSTMCCFCGRNPPAMVFFPCDHRCVCVACMKEHHIADSEMVAASENKKDMWRQCPLCAVTIAKILPSKMDGSEVEEYWTWLHNSTPALPIGFARGMERSGKALRKGSFRKGGEADVVVRQGGCCVVQ